MATGDLHNNLEKVRAELRQTSLRPDQIDVAALKDGDPVSFLPLLHFILLDDSLAVARYLNERGYQLYPINDRQFLDGVFRLVRKEFGYRPSISTEQFLGKGYAEHKLIFLFDVIKLCRRKEEELCGPNGAIGRSRSNGGSLRGRASLQQHTVTHPDQLGKSKVAASTPSSSSKGNRNSTSSDAIRNSTMSAPRDWQTKVPLSSQTNSATTSSSSSSSSSFFSSSSACSIGSSSHTSELTIHPCRDCPKGAQQRGGSVPVSPTSSSAGPSVPASPVSTTSAASAPASHGYRKGAPIRVKPDLFKSHMGTAAGAAAVAANGKAYRHGLISSSLATRAEGPAFAHFMDGEIAPASQRAMECWVSSPPQQVLERSKKQVKTDALRAAKISLAHHKSLANMSPRLRYAPCAAGVPRSSSAGSMNDVAGSKSAGATSQEIKVKGGSRNVAHRVSRGAATTPADASVHKSPAAVSRTRAPAPSIAQAPKGLVAASGENVASGPASKVDKKKISRKLALQSFSGNADSESNTSSVSAGSADANARYNFGRRNNGTNSPTTTPQSSLGNTQADEFISDAGDLTEKVTRVAMALDMLSCIPQRMDEIERKMMSALKNMDHRISELDSKVNSAPDQQVPSPGNRARPDKQRQAPGKHRSQPRRRGQGSSSSSVKDPNDNGVDSFLKLMEDRFKETESVLAQSEKEN